MTISRKSRTKKKLVHKHGEKTWKWQHRWLLPRQVAMKAIQLSLLWSNRAGLCSITPSITVINIVDSSSSPAFRLVDDLEEILRNALLRNEGVPSTPVTQSLMNMKSEFRRMFETGLASPYDQTAIGHTLFSVSHIDSYI